MDGHPPPTLATSGWPRLEPLAAWEDTCTTLHMWTQIVGKVRLALAPWVNHSWGSTLYVTSRGLTSSPIPAGERLLTIDFDLLDHALELSATDGQVRAFPLEPMSVADFYRQTLAALRALGVEVRLFARPVEVLESIPFADDEQHASYDAAAATRYWRALVQAQRVFAEFRAGFVGKVSPVHFFWGSFDLAVTRFSGRRAPLHPGGAPNCPDWVMQEAYSHELSSAGFWPGAGLGEASFYSYAYPAPTGFSERPVEPAGASFHPDLQEFVLPYEAVRLAADPDRHLLTFLRSTYAAAADLGGWDRAALEWDGPPRPRATRRRAGEAGAPLERADD